MTWQVLLVSICLKDAAQPKEYDCIRVMIFSFFHVYTENFAVEIVLNNSGDVSSPRSRFGQTR